MPVMLASIILCAPENVMYPPTVPPTRVSIVSQSICDGRTVSLSARPTGGCVLRTIKPTMASMMMPRTLVNMSIAFPASLLTKSTIAHSALMTAAGASGIPQMTLSPIAAPPTLPILKTRPPIATRTAIK